MTWSANHGWRSRDARAARIGCQVSGVRCRVHSRGAATVADTRHPIPETRAERLNGSSIGPELDACRAVSGAAAVHDADLDPVRLAAVLVVLPAHGRAQTRGRVHA